MILEFNCQESALIKSTAFKRSDQVKLTTRLFVLRNAHVFKTLSNEFDTYNAGNVLKSCTDRYLSSFLLVNQTAMILKVNTGT